MNLGLENAVLADETGSDGAAPTEEEKALMQRRLEAAQAPKKDPEPVGCAVCDAWCACMFVPVRACPCRCACA